MNFDKFSTRKLPQSHRISASGRFRAAKARKLCASHIFVFSFLFILRRRCNGGSTFQHILTMYFYPSVLLSVDSLSICTHQFRIESLERWLTLLKRGWDSAISSISPIIIDRRCYSTLANAYTYMRHDDDNRFPLCSFAISVGCALYFVILFVLHPIIPP